MHGSSKLICPSITVEVERGAVFVDPFMHQDVGDYHSLLSRYGSAFDPFGKVILHHDDILIPTFCPVEVISGRQILSH